MVTDSIRRPLAIVIGLALLIAISGSVSAPSAHASGTLTITFLDCDSGNAHFACDSYVSGGTAPYSYTWQAISNAIFTPTNSPGIYGSCTSGQQFKVKVTVQDSVGATATATRGRQCRSEPWI